MFAGTNQDKIFEDTFRIIKKHDPVVELNTGGIDKPCAEFTPEGKLLAMCNRNDVQVTISSDAKNVTGIASHSEIAVI